MNKALINSIKSQLFKATSGITTTNIYFLFLPNEELLKTFTVTFELNTKDITHSFDQKELVMDYELIININNPKYEPILDYTVFIKSRIYELVGQLPAVKTVNLSDEALVYNFDLEIYNGQLRFDVNYSNA